MSWIIEFIAAVRNVGTMRRLSSSVQGHPLCLSTRRPPGRFDTTPQSVRQSVWGYICTSAVTGILTPQPEPHLVQPWIDRAGEPRYIWQDTSGRDR